MTTVRGVACVANLIKQRKLVLFFQNNFLLNFFSLQEKFSDEENDHLSSRYKIKVSSSSVWVWLHFHWCKCQSFTRWKGGSLPGGIVFTMCSLL